ncbi:MAG: hypothetical protein KAT05_05070 [Spirochaetes bacterium]|nr:hypothetical protein [Spirochaetota bacterium]
MNDTIPESREGVIESESNLNNVLKYVLITMVVISLSDILTFGFFRGVIEIALAVASFSAHRRSRSEMIQNVTLIASAVLTFMGIFDISSSLGWI